VGLPLRATPPAPRGTKGTTLSTSTDTTDLPDSPDSPDSSELPNGFAAIGARPETVQALAAVGITQPFAIQTMTLPIALAGQDLIGQARTGTGKTLGFGVPLLQNIKNKAEGSNGGCFQCLCQ